MNKPVFRVVGLDSATCEGAYFGAETITQSKPENREQPKLSVFSVEDVPAAVTPAILTPATVTVRLKDILPALRNSAAKGLAWVNDFADDPVVISKDLYDVLLTYQRLRRTA